MCPSVGSLVRQSVGPSVRWSVGPSVRWSVGNAFVSAGRDEPANDLFRVYELVFWHGGSRAWGAVAGRDVL